MCAQACEELERDVGMVGYAFQFLNPPGGADFTKLRRVQVGRAVGRGLTAEKLAETGHPMLRGAIAQQASGSKWGQRWLTLKNRFAKIQEQGEESLMRAGEAGAGLGTFGILYYWRVRRQLEGKRVTFDEGKKIDAFFWPGLAATILGATPLLGQGGRILVGAGLGAMCAGAVDYIADMAKEHHAKK